MNIPVIKISTLSVSKFLIGGNPFSGFSHLNSHTDSEMLRYFTVSRIKETLKQSEQLGINTFLGRADAHIIRILMEYRNEGSNIQWFAQTCPEMRSIEKSVEFAIKGNANACYIHGGMMDYLLAQKRLNWMYRWLIPIFVLLTVSYLVIGHFVAWPWKSGLVVGQGVVWKPIVFGTLSMFSRSCGAPP